VSANSKNKYFEKSYYVSNSFNQKNIDFLKILKINFLTSINVFIIKIVLIIRSTN